ncbi:hypothetical protein [Mucilaginibacter sp.]
MRYINIDSLRMPDGWLARSAVAAAQIAGGTAPDDFGNLWRELKPAMLQLSHFKCWYCESPIDRDDNAVDHYRPKNRVFEALNHNGYRWLALEKSNFRLACTFCNSKRIDVDFGTAGGKADKFPLINEARRVYNLGSVDNEGPQLLDPCVIEDCELLGCQQENGRPCCATEIDIELSRVTSSIEIYHLDRDATCVRRHGIAVSLIADILEAKNLFNISQADETRKPDFKKVAKRIHTTISREAPYSGEMKYLLRGQRSVNHPWIQQLLEA